MRIIRLDCAQMTSREAVHDCLTQALELPAYYGRNLDALHDCLTEVGQPTQLELVNTAALEALGAYGQALCSTLRDAARHNPALTLSCEEPF